MSEIIELNLNDHVRVKVTPLGVDLIRKYYADLKGMGYPADLIDDAMIKHTTSGEDGRVEMQIHQMCNFFGSHFVMGCEHPIEMQIQVIRKT